MLEMTPFVLVLAAIPFILTAILLPLVIVALPALVFVGGRDPNHGRPGPGRHALNSAPKVRAFQRVLDRAETGCTCNPDVSVPCTRDIGSRLCVGSRDVEQWLAAFHRAGLLKRESRGGDQVTCRPGPHYATWEEMTA